MGKKKAKMPEQSPEAAAASKAQLAALDAQKQALDVQMHTQTALVDPLLSELGLQAVRDKDGNVTSFTRTTLSKRQTTAQDLALGREINALKGKIPVAGQTMQELNRQEMALKEQLTRTLGPDYMGTSAGQQAMADFQQRKANVIDASSRADITSMAGVVGQQQQTIDQQIQTALGVGQSTLPGIQVMGQNAAGYGSIVANDNQLRGAQFQAQQAAASSDAAGIGQLFGTAIGVLAAPYTGGASLALSGSLGGQMGKGIGSLFSSSGTGGGGFTNTSPQAIGF